MGRTKKEGEVKKESRYSKRQFIQSDMYSVMNREILKIILDDDKKYTNEEINSKLKEFKAKEVK